MRINVFIVGWWTFPFINKHLSEYKMIEGPVWSLRITNVNIGKIQGMCSQSCPAFCDHMDCSQPGSFSHGISQASILEWVAISFSRESSWPREGTHVSCTSCTGKCILYQLSHQESPRQGAGLYEIHTFPNNCIHFNRKMQTGDYNWFSGRHFCRVRTETRLDSEWENKTEERITLRKYLNLVWKIGENRIKSQRVKRFGMCTRGCMCVFECVLIVVADAYGIIGIFL